METNNKLREALEATLDLLWDMQNANRSPISNQAYAIKRKIKAALAEPMRNYEVGTAEEQWVRFKKHCKENSQADDPDYCSSRCDVDGGCVSQCALKWAQMPYIEKEGVSR